MFADEGPLYIYVGLPFKKQLFPGTVVIYNIANVYIVFPINLVDLI